MEKKYSVSIDTTPLPERPSDRVDLALQAFGPVLLEILRDAMYVAIGSWPTPEKPEHPLDIES